MYFLIELAKVLGILILVVFLAFFLYSLTKAVIKKITDDKKKK